MSKTFLLTPLGRLLKPYSLPKKMTIAKLSSFQFWFRYKLFWLAFCETAGGLVSEGYSKPNSKSVLTYCYWLNVKRVHYKIWSPLFMKGGPLFMEIKEIFLGLLLLFWLELVHALFQNNLATFEGSPLLSKEFLSTCWDRRSQLRVRSLQLKIWHKLFWLAFCQSPEAWSLKATPHPMVSVLTDRLALTEG